MKEAAAWRKAPHAGDVEAPFSGESEREYYVDDHIFNPVCSHL